ncbi:MAG TPA: alkaline phosphatase family protein, partial [Chloroflexota bacterium]|nr:alkaline phosphatase family protein [Chloroflexota bacterium]
VHRLAHQPDQLAADLEHDQIAARLAYDSGRMNRFAAIPGAIQHGVDVSDSELYASDIPNYWTYARNFVLADHFFSSVLGPSFPNHLFTVAAQSASADGNPPIPLWGCDAPRASTVEQRSATGKLTQTYPCFDFRTLPDLLDARKIDWKYYAPGKLQDGYIWSALDAIKHIRYGPDWQRNVVDYTQFARDAAAGRLPAVSWLVQPGGISDHPSASICAGENWTVRQINAIMSNRQEWAHTAIILTWDDFGGLYDHMTPPSTAPGEIPNGFRVPTIVLSPYARAGYVDHTVYTFSSIVKFVESVLGLPSLTSSDARANNMFNAFDFARPPRPALTLRPRDPCPGLPLDAGVTEPRIQAGRIQTLIAHTAPGADVEARVYPFAGKDFLVTGYADVSGVVRLRFTVPPIPGSARSAQDTVIVSSPYRNRDETVHFTVTPRAAGR